VADGAAADVVALVGERACVCVCVCVCVCMCVLIIVFLGVIVRGRGRVGGVVFFVYMCVRVCMWVYPPKIETLYTNVCIRTLQQLQQRPGANVVIAPLYIHGRKIEPRLMAMAGTPLSLLLALDANGPQFPYKGGDFGQRGVEPQHAHAPQGGVGGELVFERLVDVGEGPVVLFCMWVCVVY
jgi:hypothetical protein